MYGWLYTQKWSLLYVKINFIFLKKIKKYFYLVKNLTEACRNDTDCSSGYCLNLRCACAPDHELIDNATNCRMNLL